MHLYYTTFSSPEEAKNVCQKLVENGSIACANIFSNGTSIYRWQNEIKQEPETYALLKSKSDFQQVEKDFLALHPYDTPCLVELEVKNAQKDYLHWLIK